MALDKVRKDLHKLVDEVNDEERLKVVKELLEIELEFAQGDFWDKLSEAEKKDIEQGIKDVEEGKVFTYEEVKKSIKDDLGI